MDQTQISKSQAEINAEQQAIVADEQRRQAELAQRQAERQAQLDAAKKQAELDREQRNNRYQQRYPQGIPPKLELSTGTRGYHFSHNFQGADGNYYAQYDSNRGDRVRLFSLSEREWKESTYVRGIRCQNCQHQFQAIIPGKNICPNCQAMNDKNWY